MYTDYYSVITSNESSVINGAENISPGFNCHVYLFRPGDTNGTGEKLEYFF